MKKGCLMRGGNKRKIGAHAFGAKALSVYKKYTGYILE